MRPRKLGSSLSAKIVATILIVSSAVTFFTTGTQLIFEYKQDVGSVDKTLDLIKTGYVESISKALWDLDDQQLQIQLAGILRMPDVASIQIKGQLQKVSAGNPPKGKSVERVFSLNYVHENKESSLGEMIVTMTLENVYKKLLKRIFLVFATQLVKTLSVSILTIFVIRRLFIKPIIEVTNYLKGLDFSKGSEDLVLNRRGSEDELDSLVATVNKMKSSLFTSYSEIAILKSNLETKVEKRTSELKKVSAERQVILDTVGEGIFRLDLSGNTTFVNQAALAHLGYLSEEVIGKHQHTLIHHTRPDGSPFPVKECPIYTTINDKQSHHCETDVFWRKDGTSFPVEYTSTPVFEGDSIAGIVVVFKDISKRLKVESELRAAAHQAGMSEIATGALHNVGNVLNSANISVEMVNSRFDKSVAHELTRANVLLKSHVEDFDRFYVEDPKGKKLLNYYLEIGTTLEREVGEQKNEMKELGKRLQLIKDIISTQQSYAKGGAEFKENVSLEELVEGALIVQANSMARHKISVVKKFSKVAPVLAQRTKLTHVLMNLVKNAKEAMASNQNKESILTLEIGKEEGKPFIKISDTGIGIKKEDLGKIFNHGFTTKISGHGFGLHFCANAIAEMGGKIAVFSDGVGCGAQFVITLEEAKTEQKVA